MFTINAGNSSVGSVPVSAQNSRTRAKQMNKNKSSERVMDTSAYSVYDMPTMRTTQLNSTQETIAS